MAESLRITYIANARFPTGKAHGIQIAKMCEAFVRAGVSLELIVPGRPADAEDPFSFYALSERFAVRKLYTITVAPSTYIGFVLSSFFFGCSVLAYMMFRRGGGIVYSIDLDPLSFWSTALLPLPYFFEIHGPKKHDVVHRMLFKRIRGVIAVNQAVERQLRETFPHLSDKIVAYPNAIDAKFLVPRGVQEARRALGIVTKNPIALYAGSFQSWKGVETIVAAAFLSPQVVFYLVGGTREELMKMVPKESVIPQNVHIIRRQSSTDMPLWYAAADVLLATGTQHDSYSFRFTSPMKLYEYMASGRPIVASKTPAIEQVVTDREVFFHEPDDPRSLAGALQRAIENPKEAAQRSQSAKAKIAGYTWDTRAKNILSFIHTRL